ncbi:MAG: outer membrane protein assembly factor BamE [Kiritimatiellae bacterium]|nr:outer membrane protein assembly factor BamE [Kiritimatiellia bacterium]MDD4735614.1 outer membrane protein assembly factor BamE [Kiritimatiellia bacterium]
MKSKRIIFGLIAVAIPFLCGWIFQKPVSQDKLDSLQKGMSKEEVRHILGPPTKEYTTGQWTYSRPFVFGYINVHWDEADNYPGWYNVERF